MKICGINDIVTARAAVSAGADAIGFVFAESPRRVSPAQAASIARVVPSDVLKVAVFRQPTRAEIEAVLEDFAPDMIQADHEAIGPLHDIEIMPVFREDGDRLPGGGTFLYEGPVSGSGVGVDHRRAARVARLGKMVLAGGLRPENVATAIERVRPFGVDVSSGVELSPGVKDPALIESFVAAARAATERLVSK